MMLEVDLVGSTWPSKVARTAVTQWCRDRVLPEWSVQELALLVSEALSFVRRRARPSAVAMGWADVDHVVLLVDSIGGRPFSPVGAHEDVLAARIFDHLTVAWGMHAGPNGACYWFRTSTAEEPGERLPDPVSPHSSNRLPAPRCFG